jgi:hypothetical protein
MLHTIEGETMEAPMTKPLDKIAEDKLPPPQSAGSKRGRKPRPTEEVARYFLAKEGSSPAKPELGEETANMTDALIKAFQTKDGVIYVVSSYRAEADVQGGNPILVKRPLQK